MDEHEVRVIARQCADFADGLHSVAGRDRRIAVQIESIEDDGLLSTTLVQSM